MVDTCVSERATHPGSGNPFFAEHLDEGLELREVHDIWPRWTNESNHIEDVSECVDTKIGVATTEDVGCWI